MYKYQQVVNRIQRDIKLGLLRSTTKLPTDEQLMAQYHVSRVTIRKALEGLALQHLIDSKRFITSNADHLHDSLNHFQSPIYTMAIPEVTNVITESTVEQANPYSDDLFQRNVGAYFKVNLWYQHRNTIIANTESLVPAEIISSVGIDTYDKKAIQNLIETAIYDIGYNAQLTINTISPKDKAFTHAIQGASNADFYQISESIFDDQQKIILANKYYISTKNAHLKIYTS